VIAVSTLGFGVILVAFTLSELFWLSLALLAVVGMTWMVLIAGSNTVLQTLADDAMRGRVMSLFTMMLVGMAPFGSLLAGWLADRFGAPVVVAGGGVGCAAAALVFSAQLPRLRAAAQPILLARGIIGAAPSRAESLEADPK
jgi:MFS family permease